MHKIKGYKWESCTKNFARPSKHLETGQFFFENQGRWGGGGR